MFFFVCRSHSHWQLAGGQVSQAACQRAGINNIIIVIIIVVGWWHRTLNDDCMANRDGAPMTHASFPFRCSSFFFFFFFATWNSEHPEVAWDIVGVLRNFGTQPGALSDEGISHSEQDLETVWSLRETPKARQNVDRNVI